MIVTGGNGVIGTALVPAIETAGLRPKVFDLVSRAGRTDVGDICKPEAVREAVENADGVIHLAAVARVAWGEEDPERCWMTNVEGTKNVLRACADARRRPWMLFISSREVYGNPSRLPVVEGDLISPVNTYGRSKAAGEWLVAEARAAGVRAGCIRLPSVYGSANDIPQRVIPAFVAGALQHRDLRLTGAGQICDFLHVSDAVDGIMRMVKRLNAGARDLSTIHLASGQGTSLVELARLVTRLASSRSAIIEEPARSFDVIGFVGNPARAADVLGWAPSIALKDGLARLIGDHARRLRGDASDEVVRR